MKAAALTAERTLAPIELPDAALAEGQVRVAVRYCGICGSDLHWHRHFPAGTVMGHEVTGVIEELGPGVIGWRVGQRVCVFPAQHCGACPQCRAGMPNVCSARRFGIGGRRNRGGYADRVVVLASMLVPIPDTLDYQAAALAEPLTVALHAIAIADIGPAQPVMVIGAGAIGLMTLLALKAKGFRDIVAIEPNAARRRVVTNAGLVARSPDKAAGGSGAPPFAIFECAGYPRAITDAVGHVAPGGRIVLMSNPPEAVPVPQNELMLKEAQIRSSMFYLRSEFEEAVRLLDAKLVDIADVPTTLVALADAGEAFADLLTPGTERMKVLLHP